MATYDKEEFMNYDEYKPKEKKKKTIFKLNSKFTFGKYKGKELEPIIVKDPAYVKWCLNNVEFFGLSDRCRSLLEECKSKRKKSSRDNTYGNPGDEPGGSEAMIDCFGGSGMDGGWGSSPFG